MTQPGVNLTEIDGALGVLPPSFGDIFALVGVSDSGSDTAPATFARTQDVIAAYGGGPLVEAACHYIERFGRPVLLCRTGQTVAGDEGTLDDDGFAGTSSVTLDTAEPTDDFEVVWEAITAGEIETAGITFRWSLDGGRTWSATTALGTATTFVFPGTGGVNIDFGAGTVVAGDVLTFRTTAPNWNAAELTTALDLLAASSVSWSIVHIVGPMDGTSFDAVELAFAGYHAVGKYKTWIGSFRMPTLAETEAQYLTAFDTAFSAKSTIYGAVCAGSVKLISSVSRRQYKRPFAFPAAAFEGSVDDEVNIADVNLGPFKGVSIRDDNGNADEHDESLNPGLDDSRAMVARTWDEFPGVYVNRPQLLSSSTSDFQLLPHRRVLNRANRVVRLTLIRRLNQGIQVDKSTGFILETEAQEIEAVVEAAMRDELMAKPKASAVRFVLSRTDNVLSTKTLTYQARVTPLGYVELFDGDIGFENPALQVQTTA
jgi:hypothetical protein